MSNFTLQLLFWILTFIVFYSYIGYGIILYILLKIKRLFKRRNAYPPITDDSKLPEVTFLVAAYNEERDIEQKIVNSFALDYPKDKLRFVYVTDGSTDTTTELIQNFPNQGHIIELFHKDERRGKIAAVERAMEFVESPIVIFTDANTDVNPMAIRNIVKHFQDPTVGVVSGEKRVQSGTPGAEGANASEGIYWKYESVLKRWDSELYSVVGAAGELFAVRRELYKPVDRDTILDDFVITLNIARRGYRIAYAPDAYAIETPSASVGEEMKRKIRNSAGGLQAVWRLADLLNPFLYGWLSFQYISHRVLRWTIAPLALPILLILNVLLAFGGGMFYKILLVLQCLFYVAALFGYLFEKRKIKVKALFVPYYFSMMNYSVYRGFLRVIAGKQSVVWEKVKRA